jgi:hypothetical protein
MSVKSREFKATGKISLITERNLEKEGGKEVQESRRYLWAAEVIVKYQTWSFLFFLFLFFFLN